MGRNGGPTVYPSNPPFGVSIPHVGHARSAVLRTLVIPPLGSIRSEAIGLPIDRSYLATKISHFGCPDNLEI